MRFQPSSFHCLEDFRRNARRRLPRIIFDAMDGAAGGEIASCLNIDILNSICLQPRVLVNVETRKLGKKFLGCDWSLPFGVAPMGMGNLFWPHADDSLAKLASESKIPLGVSTMASSNLEKMFDAAGGNAWFQLYVGDSEAVTEDLIDRAKRTGYDVLILTADVPVLTPRPRDLRNGFVVPFKVGMRQFLDFAFHPGWSLRTLWHGIPKPRNFSAAYGKSGSSTNKEGFRRESGRGGIDWNSFSNLREKWPGKLILKGVMSPEDAHIAVDRGSDAVYVSNHGGRQLDSAPSTIQMLPLIREAVGSNFPLLFDSGVRSGDSVIKALAMGADFVMLGRPFLYALGALGEDGLRRYVEVLANEVSVTMAQIGCTDIEQVNDTVIVHQNRSN